MTNEEILKAATPRPWDIDPESCLNAGEIMSANGMHIGMIDTEADEMGEEQIANLALVRIAVNAYESDRAKIRALVEALNNARTILVIEGYGSSSHDNGDDYAIILEIDAALKLAGGE